MTAGMSMHWNPSRHPMVVKPSRIRRDPLPAQPRSRVRRSDQAETVAGVAGIVAIAAVVVAVIISIAWVTYSKLDPSAAAAAARFTQCYAADGPNCVVDGDTISVGKETVQIAALDTPQIANARCEGERTRGIEAAVRLVDFLNRGPVTLGAPVRDVGGRTVRKVMVKGQDVRDTMIEAGLGRRFNPESHKGWCGANAG
jgi:endonuclease YncB( thermonuclease family)